MVSSVTESLANVKPVLDTKKVADLVTSGVGDAIAKAATAHQRQVSTAVDKAAERLEAATGAAAKLGRAITWQAVGRVAAAAVPLALVLLAMAILTVPAAQILGLGPLSQWAWDSFQDAGAWWSRLLIAVTTLTVTALLCWGAIRWGEFLREAYKRW